MDSEFVLGVEPRKSNRIEKEFFTLDCSGEDKNNPLCRGVPDRKILVTVMGSTSSRSSAALDLDGSTAAILEILDKVKILPNRGIGPNRAPRP